MHVDRESLAEKSLSQAFPASNVGVREKNHAKKVAFNTWIYSCTHRNGYWWANREGSW